MCGNCGRRAEESCGKADWWQLSLWTKTLPIFEREAEWLPPKPMWEREQRTSSVTFTGRCRGGKVLFFWLDWNNWRFSASLPCFSSTGLGLALLATRANTPAKGPASSFSLWFLFVANVCVSLGRVCNFGLLWSCSFSRSAASGSFKGTFPIGISLKEMLVCAFTVAG